MEYLRLKNTDLNVSRLCVGGCPLGGHGWGTVSDKALIDSVHAALESGINFFDTSDAYGLGKSEELLGIALKGKRDHAVIASKFGVRVVNGKTTYDNSPKWINHAIESSLKRLNTDFIDLYQIHYRDRITPIPVILETLDRLKAKGFIRYYGLSNIYLTDLDELNDISDYFVSFQNEYSLACRKYEKDIVELSDKLHLTPLTWGSLGQGILTGKYDENTIFDCTDRRSREVYVNFHGEKIKKNLEIVKVLQNISRETGKSLPSIAIRFILDNLKDSVALAGVKSPEQLYSNIEAMDWKLTETQLKDLLSISAEKENDNDKRAACLEN
jgi:Predicted oxidoreductases (related to aryl-alcohol dehydrogenases)